MPLIGPLFKFFILILAINIFVQRESERDEARIFVAFNLSCLSH